jgi:carbamate kinase
MITQVLVERDDPAFQSPSKPIGPFLTQVQAEERRDCLGWKIVEDSGRGWRRLVPSPRPVRVVQRHMIRDSARAGHIVVACGGGGIPIVRGEKNDYEGIEAVIDKDLTSSVLAAEVGAELLIILTDVPQVYAHYGTREQRGLGAVTLEEIEALQAEGHFAKGSMGPKVEAIINFLKTGGKRGLITSPARLAEAMDGRAGTHFVGRIRGARRIPHSLYPTWTASPFTAPTTSICASRHDRYAQTRRDGRNRTRLEGARNAQRADSRPRIGGPYSWMRLACGNQ